MNGAVTHFFHALIGRVEGPFAFRLVLQPLTSAIIACRAGLRDARAQRPAYGWAIVTRAERRELLKEGWKELTRVFIAAVLIDMVYEIVVFRELRPGQSLVVATVLALLPYPIFRGCMNRIARAANLRNRTPFTRTP